MINNNYWSPHTQKICKIDKIEILVTNSVIVYRMLSKHLKLTATAKMMPVLYRRRQ